MHQVQNLDHVHSNSISILGVAEKLSVSLSVSIILAVIEELVEIGLVVGFIIGIRSSVRSTRSCRIPTCCSSSDGGNQEIVWIASLGLIVGLCAFLLDLMIILSH